MNQRKLKGGIFSIIIIIMESIYPPIYPGVKLVIGNNQGGEMYISPKINAKCFILVHSKMKKLLLYCLIKVLIFKSKNILDLDCYNTHICYVRTDYFWGGDL